MLLILELKNLYNIQNMVQKAADCTFVITINNNTVHARQQRDRQYPHPKLLAHLFHFLRYYREKSFLGP